jgi:hypothetical protein
VNRRGFLKRLGAAVAGYALAGELSGLLPKPPVVPIPEDLGISMRFVRSFDGDKCVNRFDVLYGWAVLNPDASVRIQP